jgi:hypothetical protein
MKTQTGTIILKGQVYKHYTGKYIRVIKEGTTRVAAVDLFTDEYISISRQEFWNTRETVVYTGLMPCIYQVYTLQNSVQVLKARIKHRWTNLWKR